MVRRRHEIPTHLNVEDKALLGLTMRQLTYLMVGAADAYSLWNQPAGVPLGLRLSLVAACLVASVALALVRPHGRGLDEWAFILLHYAARPRASVWRPKEPDVAGPRPGSGRWAELAPRLSWETGAAAAAPHPQLGRRAPGERGR